MLALTDIIVTQFFLKCNRLIRYMKLDYCVWKFFCRIYFLYETEREDISLKKEKYSQVTKKTLHFSKEGVKLTEEQFDHIIWHLGKG